MSPYHLDVTKKYISTQINGGNLELKANVKDQISLKCCHNYVGVYYDQTNSLNTAANQPQYVLLWKPAAGGHVHVAHIIIYTGQSYMTYMLPIIGLEDILQ